MPWFNSRLGSFLFRLKYFTIPILYSLSRVKPYEARRGLNHTGLCAPTLLNSITTPAQLIRSPPPTQSFRLPQALGCQHYGINLVVVVVVDSIVVVVV